MTNIASYTCKKCDTKFDSEQRADFNTKSMRDIEDQAIAGSNIVTFRHISYLVSMPDLFLLLCL